MNEQAPTTIYEKDKPLFERLRAMPMAKLLEEPITALPLAMRAFGYCNRHDIGTIGQLTMVRRKDLLKAKNMGRKTVLHIEAYLKEIGLGLDGKLSAEKATPIPSAWVRGARAMKLSVMAELAFRNIPHDVVNSIGRLPIPNPEDY